MKILFSIFIFVAFIAQEVSSKELEIVKEHSKINFDIDYMLMTKVQGQFKDYHGTLNINEDKNEIYNIKVIAVVNSIDTNDGKRDFHLKGMEFFQAANFPEILFESKGPFKMIPSKKFSVSGNLTMRGIKKNISWDVIYKGKIKKKVKSKSPGRSSKYGRIVFMRN